MKSRTAFILYFTAILTLAAGSAFGKYSGGAGNSGDPYKIATKADLLALAANTGDYGKDFILMADIDLSGETFTHAVISSHTNDASAIFDGTQFTGVFDGNDHVISNLVINASTGNYVALFGYLGSGGQIKNLGVENADITGKYCVSGLLGQNDGSTLTACYSSGSVSGSTCVGGLLGANYGTLTACYATALVSGYSHIGGLLGSNYNAAAATNCYATGPVHGTTGSYTALGGLAGDNSGTISNCYSTGAVSGATTGMGGLVGYNYDGTLTGCFWDKNTSGFTDGVGPGSSSSAGVSGKTTAQMKTQATFTAAGWDFVGETANGTADIWTMPSAGGYPILSWHNAVDVPLSFHVIKCTITAGSKVNSDKISFSGTMNATAGDFIDANNSPDANFVKVTISDANAEYMDPCVFTFPVTSKTFKKGKFKSDITSKPLKASFAFDTKKTKFSFSASNVDLTGLSCPVVIEIKIGVQTGTVDVNETIVNGPKKLIPYQLLMSAKNSLVADKVSFKRSTKPDANSLTVSGRFTTTDGPDLSNSMVITVGSQTFTVPGNQFLSKNGVVSCKAAVSNEGPLVTAKLDYIKCIYAISVNNASILQSGEVAFGIDCFGVNLDGLETINLGPL